MIAEDALWKITIGPDTTPFVEFAHLICLFESEPEL